MTLRLPKMRWPCGTRPISADAARRVFTGCCNHWPAAWELEMINTGGSRLKLVLVLLLENAAPATQQQAEAILSAFSSPSTISALEQGSN